MEKHDDPILLSYHDSIIRRSDFELLNTRNSWLNDALIGFWMDYLTHDLFSKHQDQLLCFSPSLAQLIKLTGDPEEVKMILQSLNLGVRKLILLPINDCMSFESLGGSHWALMAYVASARKFELYDSAGSSNIGHARKVADKLIRVLEVDPDKVQFELAKCHQQDNSYNCGVHLMCNAEAVCRKYLLNDNRNIKDIATIGRINSFRDELIKIINSLRNA